LIDANLASIYLEKVASQMMIDVVDEIFSTASSPCIALVTSGLR
jgi:hypothetical protein